MHTLLMNSQTCSVKPVFTKPDMGEDTLNLDEACFPPSQFYKGTEKQKQRRRTQVVWDTPSGFRSFMTARLILLAKLGLPLSHDEGVCCHACNNPACLNPNHLYLGDQSTNTEDSVYAGTHIHSPPE